jgi:hypothetical protein
LPQLRNPYFSFPDFSVVEILTTPSQIFPMIIRSFGISWSISGQWFASTILLGASPTAFERYGYKFWFLFIFSCVIYFFLVYFYLPEVSSLRTRSVQIVANREQTKGRTLEEIGLVFGDPVGLTELTVGPTETSSIDEEKPNATQAEKGREEGVQKVD